MQQVHIDAFKQAKDMIKTEVKLAFRISQSHSISIQTQATFSWEQL